MSDSYKNQLIISHTDVVLKIKESVDSGSDIDVKCDSILMKILSDIDGVLKDE